jgi:hypothetical protein
MDNLKYINSLKRDSNILTLNSGCNMEYNKNKILLKRKIQRSGSLKKYYHNANKTNEFENFLNSDNFEKQMTDNPSFFKYIYNHPEITPQIKNGFIKHNTNLISKNMKDNTTFKPIINMNGISLPELEEDIDDDEDFDEDDLGDDFNNDSDDYDEDDDYM